MVIQPLESVALHQADLGRMDALRLSLQPAGYEATEAFSVPAVSSAGGRETTDHADDSGGFSAVRTVMVCHGLLALLMYMSEMRTLHTHALSCRPSY